jgi:MYXO-CTERM domain-containing protein
MLRISTLVLALGLATAPAHASPPCACPMLEDTLPFEGATAVPTNARIFVAGGGFTATQVTLAPELDPTATVAVRLEATGGTMQETWIIPEAALAPSTRYRLVLPEPLPPRTFTTGAGPDTTAPTFETATVSGASLDGACDDHAAASVTTAGLTDDVVPADRLLLRVAVDDPASDIETRVVWLQGTRGFFGAFSSPDWQNCLHNFPSVSTARDLEVVVTAIDWSGNESTPSESATFRLQDNPWAVGCTCSTPGSGSSGGLGPLALLAAVLLVLRRRTRG